MFFRVLKAGQVAVSALMVAIELKFILHSLVTILIVISQTLPSFVRNGESNCRA